MRLTIGVTGHRDLLVAEEENMRASLKSWIQSLSQSFPDIELELLSGLATGADQLAAEVALELGIELVAVLPFERDEYLRDFSDAGERARFEALLGRADVIELPAVAGTFADAIRTDPDIRNLHYAQLGVFISSHSEILLALWDGKETHALGGTSSVVHYHLNATMPGFIEVDESPNLLADNENDLVYHLVCSRQREGGAPRPLYEPLSSYWVTSRFGRQPGSQMPEEYRRSLERLQAFEADRKKYAEELESEAGGLLRDSPDWPIGEGVRFTDRLYAHADWLAVHFQRRYSNMLLWNHVLAVLMGIVFIVYSEFIEQAWMVVVFLALFGIGAVQNVISNRRDWHRKYLDYRALAEALRVQVWWNLAGVIDRHHVAFAYDNFLQKQDVDLVWIRHVMRSASMRRQRKDPPDDRWVDWVAAQWVGEPGISGGQLAYYGTKSKVKSENYRRTVILGTVALWTGIGMAVFLGLFGTRLEDNQALLLLILMGILPLIAGVRDAYSHKKADKELIKQYQFMARVFGNARRLLDTAADLAAKRRILKAVGSAALEEHAEWLLMHRERPAEQQAGIG
ncbi:hypothetical protein F3N42_14160 [Marinihelvus fidelis]|uniref:SMODS and SLOG-associating 2TM effector domain-containing protein n=1 Tax=Marinihelvus fidelis TaxID=2613842 RepID=A0A5N0T4G2_9GAMM|nr:hypothetical protein [Marinihelvus fidelis]KAA9129793.1 hypothetical protein F3N42_14160 [Marinihelvus fidelis]